MSFAQMFSNVGLSEIKTNQKGIVYLCAQVQLCVLGHYLQKPFLKFTSVAVPSLGLRLIIHTLQAVQDNGLLEV